MTRVGEKPVRRVVKALGQDMVAEIRGEFLTLRPLRSRKGSRAELAIKGVTIYGWGLPSRRRRVQ